MTGIERRGASRYRVTLFFGAGAYDSVSVVIYAINPPVALALAAAHHASHAAVRKHRLMNPSCGTHDATSSVTPDIQHVLVEDASGSVVLSSLDQGMRRPSGIYKLVPETPL